ncbi:MULTISPECIES: HutD family protein [unclassified Mesorhizobium]|uniref:HutD/Ves family protein n=1 Tax=unclassified Mesorhizobium TaxID=325217 RepID=UPI00112A46DF|nr:MULTISPECIES: HutD family protein [unclassified Mesorhizobium]MCA0023144.1 HutD family protein [Mesorhizobium sp. B263B1A]TPJ98932.1 HutD family protein [Mesorhizobium sp. B2-5-12]TPK29097.1 HutD family protein [Mesorhizobium sp. B2-5-6]TPM54175.1 HutD family protein [Mesorhizobium sp. B2-2-4]TPM64603.1 HutD family protein [Mesorhizobium sp. B2-2-1]
MRVLRAAEYKSMPWKNGGGVTTEIAVSPADAGLDAFDWRVSMARVESGGPFSSFAGIDRTLSVLEGEGIVLDVAGQPPARLTAASAPLSFPADRPTGAELIAGPITDLNVMTRRGRMRHSVERLVISNPLEIGTESRATLVLCLGGEVVVAAAEPVRLGHLDALLTASATTGLRIQPIDDTTVFVVRIDGIRAND